MTKKRVEGCNRSGDAKRRLWIGVNHERCGLVELGGSSDGRGREAEGARRRKYSVESAKKCEKTITGDL